MRVAVLLALASAVTWGGSDFLGGVASRRGGAYAVTVGAQVAGGLTLLVIIGFLPGSPDVPAMLWGGLAGLGGGAGLVLYFRALARGPMSLVSPTAAAVGAVVPLTVGLALGERPGRIALVGAMVAIVAIVLVCIQGRTGSAETAAFIRVLPITLGSALGFGMFFVAVSQAPETSGLWPLVAARGVSVPLLLLGGLATRRSPWPHRAFWITFWCGVGDMAANALFLLAVREGLLSLTAVLASLYPVPTVVLAGVLLRERLGPRQWTGVGLALVAAVLVSL